MSSYFGLWYRIGSRFAKPEVITKVEKNCSTRRTGNRDAEDTTVFRRFASATLTDRLAVSWLAVPWIGETKVPTTPSRASHTRRTDSEYAECYHVVDAVSPPDDRSTSQTRKVERWPGLRHFGQFFHFYNYFRFCTSTSVRHQRTKTMQCAVLCTTEAVQEMSCSNPVNTSSFC